MYFKPDSYHPYCFLPSLVHHHCSLTSKITSFLVLWFCSCHDTVRWISEILLLVKTFQCLKIITLRETSRLLTRAFKTFHDGTLAVTSDLIFYHAFPSWPHSTLTFLPLFVVIHTHKTVLVLVSSLVLYSGMICSQISTWLLPRRESCLWVRPHQRGLPYAPAPKATPVPSLVILFHALNSTHHSWVYFFKLNNR